MLIQTYLKQGSLDTEKILHLDWTNNMMDLGFILGISSQIKVDPKILESIASNTRLNSSIRLVALMRSLESMSPEIERVSETDKEAGRTLLERFDHLATSINHLKDHIGLLKDSISKVFSATTKKLLEKCNLNHKITLLGIQTYKNHELLDFVPSLKLLSLEDLEKLDRHKEISPGEVLTVIKKSCEIIFSKKIRAGDPLSILTYNTFYDVLKFSNIQDKEFQFSQSLILEFKENFTPKQKKCFLAVSSDISKKQGFTLDPKILDFDEKNSQIKTQKDEDWIYMNKVSIKSLEKVETGKEEHKKVETDAKESQGHEEQHQLRDIVASMFEKLYYEIEDDLQNKKNVNIDELRKQLQNIFDISSYFLYEEIEYYSKIEKKNKVKLTLWKLVSKALHLSKMFTLEQRHTINRHIDKLNEERKYRY